MHSGAMSADRSAAGSGGKPGRRQRDAVRIERMQRAARSAADVRLAAGRFELAHGHR